MSEQHNRNHPRYNIEHDIRWRALEFNSITSSYINSLVSAGHTENISEGGLFVKTSESFPIGTPIELYFFSQEEQKEIRFFGRVARITQEEKLQGIGIEVLNISKDDIQKLMDSDSRHRP